MFLLGMGDVLLPCASYFLSLSIEDGNGLSGDF